jgi:hypothetical protein
MDDAASEWTDPDCFFGTELQQHLNIALVSPLSALCRQERDAAVSASDERREKEGGWGRMRGREGGREGVREREREREKGGGGLDYD